MRKPIESLILNRRHKSTTPVAILILNPRTKGQTPNENLKLRTMDERP